MTYYYQGGAFPHNYSLNYQTEVRACFGFMDDMGNLVPFEIKSRLFFFSDLSFWRGDFGYGWADWKY